MRLFLRKEVKIIVKCFAVLLALCFVSFSQPVYADFEEEESESEYVPQGLPIADDEQEAEREEIEEVPVKEEVQTKKEPRKPEAEKPTKKQTPKSSIDNRSNKPKKIKQKPKKKPVKNVKKTKRKNDKLRKKPIKLKSEGLKGSRSTGKVILKKNVQISQGDLEITCDEASILFDEKNEEIEKVIAEGKVKMKKLDETTNVKISANSRKMEGNTEGFH